MSYTINGTYGSRYTPCKIFVVKENDLFWYCVKGSKNVNATYDKPENGVDVETIVDTYCVTADSPINSIDDLITCVMGEDEDEDENEIPMGIEEIKTEKMLDLYIEGDKPAWIEETLDTDTLRSILIGGCASGAYMSAVEGHEAVTLMSEYGYEIIDFLFDENNEVSQTKKEYESWGEICCYYVTTAVETYCSRFIDCIDEIDERKEKLKK